MVAPHRFLSDVYPQYPDNDSVKVFFQAYGFAHDNAGNRHVLLWWANAELADTADSVIQVIHLSGGVGNYNYYSPLAQLCSAETFIRNAITSLGKFTREQRDLILELAKAVKFVKRSTVNGCQPWLRELLLSMVENELIEQAIFDELATKTSLKQRVPEA
jgi:hypothetical protein